MKKSQRHLTRRSFTEKKHSGHEIHLWLIVKKLSGHLESVVSYDFESVVGARETSILGSKIHDIAHHGGGEGRKGGRKEGRKEEG